MPKCYKCQKWEHFTMNLCDSCLKELEGLMEEIIGFLERNEMDIIKDVDTIGFIIQGLKKEGIQYILDDKKEWEEHPNK